MVFPIAIPLERLSQDFYTRHAQLRDYFCDKDAVVVKNKKNWLLSLDWSNDPYRYIDPRLKEGLDWWGGDVEYKGIALERRRLGRVMFSLNDTWTLESWSEWLQKNPQHQNITVLHVDDHKDLGSPRIFRSKLGWVDFIGGESVDFEKPGTIEKAILSGALGMGSFLTPFIHHLPDVEIRHLCQKPKCTQTVDSAIKLEWQQDNLLAVSEYRPSVSLLTDGKGTGSGRYRFTDNVDAWLEGLTQSENAILLHIDMDYFCNRYDGDSDALEQPYPLNLSLEKVLIKVDELTNALHRHSLVDRLNDIVIAFSPGFFPAEFWAVSCNRLLSGLGEESWRYA